ncbi:MAG: hypothetical protein JSV47_07905, partial [Deltaproteobacteria bacterium]
SLLVFNSNCRYGPKYMKTLVFPGITPFGHNYGETINSGIITTGTSGLSSKKRAGTRKLLIFFKLLRLRTIRHVIRGYKQ